MCIRDRSIPTFWFGLVVIYIFSVDLGWLPAGGMFTIGDGSLLDCLHHLIGPALVLALVTVAIWSRYMRSAMLDVSGQDFVRTAVAKGLPRRVVIMRHVLRNALLPMITLAGLQLPTLLGGALVTETVFSWPGMGQLFLQSVQNVDIPIMAAYLLFIAFLFVIINLVVDLLYAAVDPRLRVAIHGA